MPKHSFTHAASLHQGSPHCAISPTAASRRSLGRVSVPMWPSALSGRLPIVALVGRCPANKLIGRGPIACRDRSLSALRHAAPCAYAVLAVVSSRYPPACGRLSTRYSPVRHSHAQSLGFMRMPVRLACVRHAASVHPEPGSNSHVVPCRPIPLSSLRSAAGSRQLPRVSSGSFRFVLGRVKLFFVSLNSLHPRGWPGQVSLALLDWNIQGRIAVHLSRCCAVFISGNFDRISYCFVVVNHFFAIF